MLLRTEPDLEELLVAALAREPGLCVNELQLRLRSVGHAFTKQGIYRKLHTLRDQAVVYKDRKCFRLHYDWVSALVTFTNQVAKCYLADLDGLPPLPPQVRRFSWKFTDLLRANDFWMNLTYRVLSTSRSKTYLSWTPHPWFHLLQGHQEERYWRTIRKLGIRCFKIVGGETPLDKKAAQFWDIAGVAYSFAESPFEGKRAEYFTVIGNDIMTLKIDAATARSIDKLYASSAAGHAIDISKAMQLFREPAQVKLCLERSQSKSRKLQRQFQEFFGVEIRDSSSLSNRRLNFDRARVPRE